MTKMTDQRIRVVLSKLVGLTQCSFIPRRHSLDNIIITHEVFQPMWFKQGKCEWMTIKIDLEKAYDRLSWEFMK